MDPDKNIYPEWDSSNDYSYSDLISFEDDNAASAITDKVVLYADDKLIWGTEPDGTTAGSVSEYVKQPVKEETTTKPTASSNNNATKAAYGDANCDGTVDMSDVVLIMQALSNPNKYGLKGTDKNHLTEEGQNNADCDLASVGMSTNDALTIQKYLLKQISTLPVR